jgi:glycosyltransferase involved in cell wall biosynthesis
LRILVLADIPPYVIGGAEMQAWRLARAWSAMGHEVQIAGHRIPDGLREEIQLHRLPVLKTAGRSVRGLTYFLSLARFLRKKRRQYDLIYCRFLGEAALSVATVKQLRLIGLPLVAVPAAGGAEGQADLALLQSLPATLGLIDLLSRQCDCINYIAPGIERTILEAGIVPNRTSHIPNGVTVPENGIDEHRTSRGELLFVGRLTYQKGLDQLLPVFARLQQSECTFHCTLIGDGPLRAGLENQALRLGIAERLSFLGAQPQSVVQTKLAEAQAFLLPSRYEGLSNAALEALAQGVPCALSQCGGVDTYLSAETGWVFDANDPGAMEKALIEALAVTPARWQTMSRACRALAIEKFSLENVARSYLEMFEELVCSSSKAAAAR